MHLIDAGADIDLADPDEVTPLLLAVVNFEIEMAEYLIDAGANVITTGNHVWDQREALVFIERAPRLIRPVNFPPGTPGRWTAARAGWSP